MLVNFRSKQGIVFVKAEEKNKTAEKPKFSTFKLLRSQV